jgi:hypothetical protein
LECILQSDRYDLDCGFASGSGVNIEGRVSLESQDSDPPEEGYIQQISVAPARDFAVRVPAAFAHV